MTYSFMLETIAACHARLGRLPTQRDLGVTVARLEDLAVATVDTPGHVSIIWALGATGRAAASDTTWGLSHLTECAQGHLDAARDQLRVALAEQNLTKAER